MRAVRIGIAGEIGAGKSFVARLFGEEGCWVHDADAVARRVLADDDFRSLLRERWGDRVFAGGDAEAGVDRSAIASIVFANQQERAWLEGVVHPRVRAVQAAVLERADAAVAARDDGAPAAVVLDVPLLFEAGLDALCDLVAFVTAPRGVRLERVQRTRGWDDAELSRREAAQMDAEQKRARSGVVIENGGGEDAARDVVREVLAGLRGGL